MSIVLTSLAIGIVIVVGFLFSIYRVASIDKVLIITGGPKPVIKISGGSFVIPIFRRADYFDLCMLTVKADKDEIRTTTSVPIVTDWTAQIRPDTQDTEKLLKAIISFKERGQKGITDDVKLTLTGAVRDIVASMTPEEVLRDKAVFAQKVRDIVADEMTNMGLELVSLNIQDISDYNGYFDNLAAADSEQKRQQAEIIKAQADQAVRQQKADSEQRARESELASDLAVAEKQRDNAIKQAQFKTEMDIAEANAAIAGQLQATTRQRELAVQEGQVEVVRQEQSDLAARKEMAVIETRATAARIKAEIEAQAAAAVKEKEAEAQAKAVLAIAEGEANAKRALADAMANETAITGEAEAQAIRAKALAEAEGEKALAEARAANEGVNFEIAKLEIETRARIEIATATASIMAELGKNARFIDLGGGGKDSNVLFDAIGQIPHLLAKMDLTNEAVSENGEPFGDTAGRLVRKLLGKSGGEGGAPDAGDAPLEG